MEVFKEGLRSRGYGGHPRGQRAYQGVGLCGVLNSQSGRDGHVRVVDLKTSCGTITRPVVKLVRIYKINVVPRLFEKPLIAIL